MTTPGRPEPGGEPVHVRAQSVTATLAPDGTLDVRGSLLDLRTRGFLPVGGSMQGMGIIHHMELAWTVDAAAGTVVGWRPVQPTVAFEATAETGGESCRDPLGRLTALGATPLGRPLSAALREQIGGPLGCSHLVTLGLFMDAALRAGLARRPPGAAHAAPRPLWRRDVVFDAHEETAGRVAVAVRLADLDWNDAPADALAPERFARLHELAARVDADLWPGTLAAITGAERLRTAARFTAEPWTDRATLLAPLAGIGLARGAAAAIATGLGDGPEAAPWRDALAMLPPALVQCRAAHPDAWHEKVRATPRHPGLTALPDSCFMWRRDGALERIRQQQGAGKGGR
ncbi:MAG: DUF2889 domain-containing protein [bacterium]|nr:DUF2889 domain-containing protein [bacterium]